MFTEHPLSQNILSFPLFGKNEGEIERRREREKKGKCGTYSFIPTEKEMTNCFSFCPLSFSSSFFSSFSKREGEKERKRKRGVTVDSFPVPNNQKSDEREIKHDK